ncbi:hypothetical protein FGG78_17825 [Thioclava sp. BHET1]|nr:hypothetical protein FGG78_17825 [Thioclava sp. BHET1]
MSEVAALYRSASLMSQEPTMQTLVLGIRGLRTFMARAVRAIEAQNSAAKIDAVARASDLLTFLQGITGADDTDMLGGRLSGLYTAFHVKLTAAHAQNDTEGFRWLAAQLGQLETELQKLA